MVKVFILLEGGVEGSFIFRRLTFYDSLALFLPLCSASESLE